jgi:calcium-dependent protein kinase
LFNEIDLEFAMEVNSLIALWRKDITVRRSQLLYLNKFYKLFFILIRMIFVIGNSNKLLKIFCNRDLKPENFLFENKKEGALIKLIDFGLSTSYLEEVHQADGRSMKVLTKLKTCAGTSLYMAPEVIMKQYSSSCDIWSAGVILYIMLSGYPPFYGENDMDVFEKITRFEYDFEGTLSKYLIHIFINR